MHINSWSSETLDSATNSQRHRWPYGLLWPLHCSCPSICVQFDRNSRPSYRIVKSLPSTRIHWASKDEESTSTRVSRSGLVQSHQSIRPTTRTLWPLLTDELTEHHPMWRLLCANLDFSHPPDIVLKICTRMWTTVFWAHRPKSRSKWIHQVCVLVVFDIIN